MNVVAFVPHPPAGASTRYRVHQFGPALAARGIHLVERSLLDDAAFARLYRPGQRIAKVRDLLAGGARRLRHIAAARDADAVLVHRELWPLRGLLPERLLQARNPRWVFDLDDAVWLPNVSPANRGFAALKAHAKSPWLAAHARAITAGNRYLAAWAAEHVAPGGRVFHVPTAVDVRRWRPAARAGASTEGIVLGWIGSPSTAPYLASIAGALARLSAAHPALRLRVIGADIDLPGVRVERVPWSLDSEVAALAGADIALAPQPDGPWARGKCGLKVVQSMAVGLPVVTSPTGAHPDLVEDGVTGRFADGEDAWVEAIDGLVRDADARRRMGAAARAAAEERFSIEAVAPALEAALRHAAGAA